MPQQTNDLGRIDLDAEKARQDRRGGTVVTVLVVSTIVVIVAFAAIWLFHAPGLSGGGGQVRVSPGNECTPYVPARQKEQTPRPSQPIAR